jgi:hypothetical protein
MNYLFSVAIGALTGACAVLLHNFALPFGPILAILGTLISIWAVGRKFGKRTYKVVAAISWILIFSKASLLGSGGELLVQGDNSGSALLFFGFTALIVAIVLPA